MPYKLVDSQLVKEDENFISVSSPKTVLFEALKMQVKRAEAAEARVAELETRVEALETEVMQQHHIASACAEAAA